MKYFVSFLIFCMIFISGASAQELSADVTENVQDSVYINDDELSNIKESVNQTLSKVLPGAQILSIEEIEENNEKLIRCKVSYNGLELGFKMNPKTGAISNFESNKGSFITKNPEIITSKAGVKLTSAQVNKMLKKTLPGAAIKKVKYDKKSGIIEGYALYKSLDYFFQIDAIRGNVIKLEPAIEKN